MRIIFMGSPDFALPCFNELMRSSHQLVAAITQPDRPKGRGNRMTPTPVKEKAREKQIPVYQPEKVNTPDFVDLVQALAPDLMVVVAFGQILKPALLNIPLLGCVNVHASLLPYYRGAAPIHWSIINGEKATGVTTMYMDAGMDTGDIILRETVEITAEDTAGSLHDKLAVAGAELLRETLALIDRCAAPRIPQDHSKATYAPLLTREHEVIDWRQESRQVYNQVRGMNPWPGAYTTFNHRQLKIWETRIEEEESSSVPGIVLDVINGRGIRIQCKRGSVWLTQVQPQGKRCMEGDAFARGYRVEKGCTLGSVWNEN